METIEKFLSYLDAAWQCFVGAVLSTAYFLGFLTTGIGMSVLAYITLPVWPLIAGFWIANRWWYPPEKKKPSPSLP